MLLARITSNVPIPQLQFGKLTDGVWELDVTISLSEARRSGDPKGYAQHQIAAHLAQCVRTTEMPLGFELWRVEFSREARRMFNFPGAFIA